MLPSRFNDALHDLGVTHEAIAMPPALGFAHVIFEDEAPVAHLAEFDSGRGEAAIMLPTIDHEEVCDWIAWAPAANRYGALCGVFGIVGEMDLIFNPATYLAGGSLHVCDGALEWLRRKRDGILVIDPPRAVGHLACARKISVSSPAMQRKVSFWIKRQQPEIVRID